MADIIDRTKGRINQGWIFIEAQWHVLWRALSIIVVWVGGLLIIYGALVNTVVPSGFGLVDDNSRPLWTQLGSVSALLLGFIRPLWLSWKGDGHLRHVIVSERDQTDMKQMAKFMKNAENVTIYSGDFSYIYDHDPLYQILLNLAKRDNLTFISYKSQQSVTTSSSSERGEKECIISTLIKANRIFFEMSGRAKFSLISKRGEEVLLYKHHENEADYVTIFRAANGMSKQLVETIKTLVDVATKNAPIIEAASKPDVPAAKA